MPSIHRTVIANSERRGRVSGLPKRSPLRNWLASCFGWHMELTTEGRWHRGAAAKSGAQGAKATAEPTQRTAIGAFVSFSVCVCAGRCLPLIIYLSVEGIVNQLITSSSTIGLFQTQTHTQQKKQVFWGGASAPPQTPPIYVERPAAP